MIITDSQTPGLVFVASILGGGYGWDMGCIWDVYGWDVRQMKTRSYENVNSLFKSFMDSRLLDLIPCIFVLNIWSIIYN